MNSSERPPSSGNWWNAGFRHITHDSRLKPWSSASWVEAVPDQHFLNFTQPFSERISVNLALNEKYPELTTRLERILPMVGQTCQAPLVRLKTIEDPRSMAQRMSRKECSTSS